MFHKICAWAAGFDCARIYDRSYARSVFQEWPFLPDAWQFLTFAFCSKKAPPHLKSGEVKNVGNGGFQTKVNYSHQQVNYCHSARRLPEVLLQIVRDE